MKHSFYALFKLSFLAFGLAACSAGKEESAQLTGTETSKKNRAPAVYKGDAKQNASNPMTDNLNDQAKETPAGRASRQSDAAAGSSGAKASKKEEESKAKTEELKAILDFEKAKMETAERMARQEAINDRSEKSEKSKAMMQSFMMLTTLITARQQQQAIASLSQKPDSKSTSADGCDTSAVGTAKDDFGDILATMATYGLVSNAGGM